MTVLHATSTTLHLCTGLSPMTDGARADPLLLPVHRPVAERRPASSRRADVGCLRDYERIRPAGPAVAVVSAAPAATCSESGLDLSIASRPLLHCPAWLVTELPPIHVLCP